MDLIPYSYSHHEIQKVRVEISFPIKVLWFLAFFETLAANRVDDLIFFHWL